MLLSTTSTGFEQQTPTVSVVIPAYNAARYIRQALDSVQEQTFTDYEVIVVNDGSTDREELERVLHSHPLPIIYISQANRGVSAARNAAIKIGRGTFYAQLDADDQWKPHYLEVQVGILAENPGIALVYPNAMIIGEGSDAGLEFMDICPSEGEVSFDSLIQQKCTVMTCVTARLNVIKQAGMFDETIRSCEDFDLWLRILKMGERIIYHRQVLVFYRRHEGSLSSDRVWMTSNLLAVLEKTAKTLDLTAVESEIVNEEIARSRASLQLFESKHALSRGEASVALVRLERANKYLRSTKLALVILLLRYMPRLTTWAFSARERLLVKHPEYRLTGIDKPRGISSADSLKKSGGSECIP